MLRSQSKSLVEVTCSSETESTLQCCCARSEKAFCKVQHTAPHMRSFKLSLRHMHSSKSHSGNSALQSKGNRKLNPFMKYLNSKPRIKKKILFMENKFIAWNNLHTHACTCMCTHTHTYTNTHTPQMSIYGNTACWELKK